MSNHGWTIRRLHDIEPAQLDELTAMLIDCVNNDESLGFLRPMTPERARAFWVGAAGEVERGGRALLIAEDDAGICGSVQLILALPENQPHRADLAKMMVHRRARRRGVGAELLLAAERLAREAGRTLLVLDAVTGGDAARLYAGMGWVRVGDIPGYALTPGGELCGTTVFYRDLRGG